MKAIFTALKRSPKLTALTAVLAAAIVIPAGLLAWGPTDRELFTRDNPADYVTFNSITDNLSYGNETNFVRIKEVSQPNSAYTDEIQVQPGKEYELYVFYHNNAKRSLNASGQGVAIDTKLRMEMPAVIKAGQTAAINGYVSASNATPQTVWDSARASSNADVALRYIPNSASIHNDGATNGHALPENIWTTGTPLGFNQLDGVLPGCNEYSGYVKLRIVADYADFSVQKTVSKSGQNQYSESVSAKPGDKVDYKIAYENLGSMQQNNVVIKDTLPAGVTYIPGTTHLSNSVTGNKWQKVDSNEIANGGINIGDYAPNGGNAFVKFTAKIEDVPCGTNTLVNKASANTDNGAKSDTADVVVTKECAPGEISVCDLTTRQIITIQEKDFDSNKHSKNLLDCAGVPVYELPQTGISSSALTLAGIGLLTAAIVYAVRSPRVRNLLRG